MEQVVENGNIISDDAPKERFNAMDSNSLPRSLNKSEPGTGLLRAARAGNLEKVLEFLKGGVDINTCNANGLNGLHLASKDGHVSVVRELLERKANVNATTKKGNAAIHIASLAGQEEVVRILIEHGASVNLQSTNGFTPLYMASQENHDGIVKLLLANGANQSLATEDMFTPLAVAMQQGHDKVVAILLESDVRGKVRLPALHIAAKKDDCKAAALLLQSSANPDVTSKSMFTPLHIASHYGNLAVATLLLDRGADVNFQAKHNITPLHVAAKWGKAQVCALLLDRGGSIEAKTRDGLTPLHCAARSGHEQVVDLLLERQAPISSKTKNGIVPLAMCAQGDHVDAARILLYHKAPVDDVTVDYLTSLHVAAHCGHVRIAKLLLDRKADPNARALNGFTPLHIACKKNRIKVVELLLKNGAHIEAATESGLTPLHVSAFMGSMNIAIFLLQNEAKPDATTVRGETPLHLAARANQTDIVRILLRNNANVDSAAKEGQTPLHIASRLGNADLVMLLLQSGATVDAPTKEMYTALHVAAKAGQEEVAAILLDKGADVAARTSRGWTPLHLAGKYNTGNTKVANLLISRGAPVNAEGKNQLTPLHTSCHHKNNEVALLLLNNEADPKCLAKNNYSPLHIAAKQNQIDIATALLEYGAEVNGQSRQGYTPIHLAADQGNTDMVALLIQHGGDANAGAKNQLRPLHLAAQNDHVRSASVLVSSGNAEIDPQTQSGYSPLHVASHFGQAGMVRYLLQNGANVHLTTEAGNTALHHAAQQGQTLIITLLLEKKADPDVVNNSGQNPLAIAEKLGYVSVVETLKIVTTTITTTTTTTTTIEERYKVLAPESMNENLASDSEDEGAEDAANEAYRYLTVDDMKSLGDDSMPIDVTRDEQPHRDSGYLHGDDKYENIVTQKYTQLAADNVDISRTPIQIGKLHWRNFLVSFMVDARGGAMRGCRHSGVRVIIPPRKAASPMRITCRYLKKDRLVHPPPLMEGEALASRILELGPAAAKFLGPVILEVPHFASLRGHEREIVILRSDNGETWREHNLDATEEAVQDVLNESFDANDLKQLEDLKTNRITRILTTDFPQYFALVSRIRQEVHAVGPEGGMVSSTVVPQVQAVFPQGALTKRIKVGLQAQPIHIDLVNKVAGSRVSVSPIVTVEPRRRKFHKPITLTIPKPKSQDPNCVLRLLCSITGVFRKRSLKGLKGGTTRAQWEDVTGSTPLSIVNDCISFTTTVSARFWLIDCRHASHDVTRMATDLYREVIHVPFMAKFVIFAKRIELTEARLRVFCMTDDREEKTLEGQEHFTEVAKSRDVEVLEGKQQWIEMAGNLAPVTKSGEQLRLKFIAFRENRLPFLVRLRDVNADAVGRIIFMRDSKSSQKGDQAPVCNLNIVLPDQIMPDEPSLPPSISSSPRLPLHTNRYNIKNVAYSSTPRHGVLSVGEIHRGDLKISDVANLLDDDWIPLARNLGITDPDITIIEAEYPQSPHQQATVMLRLWMQQAGDRATGNTLEKALDSIGRGDIIKHCIGNIAPVTDASEKLLAQSQVALESQIIQPQTKQDRRNLSLDDEQDLMKDSESLEDLSQTDAFRNKQAKRRSMTPTDEEGGPNVMTSSYERDEQKYSAEEKESRPEEKVSAKVHWEAGPGDEEVKSVKFTTTTTTTITSAVDRASSKSEESVGFGTPEKGKHSYSSEEKETESQSQSAFDTGISVTTTSASVSIIRDSSSREPDTEGEVSDFSLTSPKKETLGKDIIRKGVVTPSSFDDGVDDSTSSRVDDTFTLTEHDMTDQEEEDDKTLDASVPNIQAQAQVPTSLTLTTTTTTSEQIRVEKQQVKVETAKPQKPTPSPPATESTVTVKVVDKACSPLQTQVGTPEKEKLKPETVSRSQQMTTESVDAQVGTSPQDTKHKDVLTRLHNLTNMPIGDDEIYTTLKNQEAEMLSKSGEVVHSKAIETPYSGGKGSVSSTTDLMSPPATKADAAATTSPKGTTSGSIEDDEMQFDLSIEEEEASPDKQEETDENVPDVVPDAKPSDDKPSASMTTTTTTTTTITTKVITTGEESVPQQIIVKADDTTITAEERKDVKAEKAVISKKEETSTKRFIVEKSDQEEKSPQEEKKDLPEKIVILKEEVVVVETTTTSSTAGVSGPPSPPKLLQLQVDASSSEVSTSDSPPTTVKDLEEISTDIELKSESHDILGVEEGTKPSKVETEKEKVEKDKKPEITPFPGETAKLTSLEHPKLTAMTEEKVSQEKVESEPSHKIETEKVELSQKIETGKPEPSQKIETTTEEKVTLEKVKPEPSQKITGKPEPSEKIETGDKQKEKVGEISPATDKPSKDDIVVEEETTTKSTQERKPSREKSLSEIDSKVSEIEAEFLQATARKDSKEDVIEVKAEEKVTKKVEVITKQVVKTVVETTPKKPSDTTSTLEKLAAKEIKHHHVEVESKKVEPPVTKPTTEKPKEEKVVKKPEPPAAVPLAGPAAGSPEPEMGTLLGMVSAEMVKRKEYQDHHKDVEPPASHVSAEEDESDNVSESLGSFGLISQAVRKSTGVMLATGITTAPEDIKKLEETLEEQQRPFFHRSVSREEVLDSIVSAAVAPASVEMAKAAKESIEEESEPILATPQSSSDISIEGDDESVPQKKTSISKEIVVESILSSLVAPVSPRAVESIEEASKVQKEEKVVTEPEKSSPPPLTHKEEVMETIVSAKIGPVMSIKAEIEISKQTIKQDDHTSIEKVESKEILEKVTSSSEKAEVKPDEKLAPIEPTEIKKAPEKPSRIPTLTSSGSEFTQKTVELVTTTKVSSIPVSSASEKDTNIKSPAEREIITEKVGLTFRQQQAAAFMSESDIRERQTEEVISELESQVFEFSDVAQKLESKTVSSKSEISSSQEKSATTVQEQLQKVVKSSSSDIEHTPKLYQIEKTIESKISEDASMSQTKTWISNGTESTVKVEIEKTTVIVQKDTKESPDKEKLSPAKETEKASPVKEEEKVLPVKEVEKVSPAKDAKTESPVKEAEKESPAKEEEKVSPAKEAEKVSPVKEAEKVSPVKEAEKVSPAKAAEKVSPVKEAEKVSPAKAAEKVSPAKEVEKVSPAKEAEKVSPVKEVEQISPAKEAGKVSPVKDAKKDSPVNEADKVSPVKEAEKVSPAKEAEKVSPAKEAEKLSPVKETEKVSPVKETKKVSPAKEAEKISPAKEVEKVSPVKEVEKVSPVKEVEKVSPVKEVEKVLPVKEVEKVLPVKEVEKVSPVKEVEKVSPVKEVEKVSPVKEVEKVSPVKEVEKVSPVKEVEKVSPVKEVEKVSPVKEVEKVLPVKEVEKVSPVKEVEKVSPVKEVEKVSPVKEVEKVSPVKEVEKVSPVKEVEKVSPVKEAEKIAPAKEVEKVSPVKDTEKLLPAKETDKSSPAKEAEKVSPAKEEEKILPVKDTEKLSPAKASEKELEKLSVAKDTEKAPPSLEKEKEKVSPEKEDKISPGEVKMSPVTEKVSPEKEKIPVVTQKEKPSPAKQTEKVSPAKEKPSEEVSVEKIQETTTKTLLTHDIQQVSDLDSEIERLEKEVFHVEVEEKKAAQSKFLTKSEKAVEDLDLEKIAVEKEKKAAAHSLSSIQEKPDLNLFQQLCVVHKEEEEEETEQTSPPEKVPKSASADKLRRDSESKDGDYDNVSMYSTSTSSSVITVIEKGSSQSLESQGKMSLDPEPTSSSSPPSSLVSEEKVPESSSLKITTTTTSSTLQREISEDSPSTGSSTTTTTTTTIIQQSTPEKSPRKKPNLTDVEKFVDEAREAAAQLKQEVKILRPDLTPTPTDQNLATTPVLRAMFGIGADSGGWLSDEDKLETVLEVEEKSPKRSSSEISSMDASSPKSSRGGDTPQPQLQQEVLTTEALEVFDKEPESVSEGVLTKSHPTTELSAEMKEEKVTVIARQVSESRADRVKTPDPTDQKSTKAAGGEFKEVMYFKEYTPRTVETEVSSSPKSGSTSPPSTTSFSKSSPITTSKVSHASHESLVKELKLTYEAGEPQQTIHDKEAYRKDAEDKDKDTAEEIRSPTSSLPRHDSPTFPRLQTSPLGPSSKAPVTKSPQKEEGDPALQHIHRDVSASSEELPVKGTSPQKSVSSSVSPEQERKSKKYFGPTKLIGKGKAKTSTHSLPDLQYQIQVSFDQHDLPRPKSAPAVITSEVFVKNLDVVYSYSDKDNEPVVIEQQSSFDIEIPRGTGSSSENSTAVSSATTESSRCISAAVSSVDSGGFPPSEKGSDVAGSPSASGSSVSDGVRSRKDSSDSKHSSGGGAGGDLLTSGEPISRTSSTSSSSHPKSGGSGGEIQSGDHTATESGSSGGSSKHESKSVSVSISRSGSEASSKSSRSSKSSVSVSGGSSHKASTTSASSKSGDSQSQGSGGSSGGGGGGGGGEECRSGGGSLGSGGGGGQSGSRSSLASSPLSISLSGGSESRTSESTELLVTRLSPPRIDPSGQFPNITDNLTPFISFTYSVKERELSAQAPPRTQEEEPEYEPVGQSSWSQEEQEQEQAPVGEGWHDPPQIQSKSSLKPEPIAAEAPQPPLEMTIKEEPEPEEEEFPIPESSFFDHKPHPGRETSAPTPPSSPIHAEVKLLVRTSENGRESVEIRSVKEVRVPSPVAPPSPQPRKEPLRQNPTPPDDDQYFYGDDDEERIASPIITQKLVVRFQEEPIVMQESQTSTTLRDEFDPLNQTQVFEQCIRKATPDGSVQETVITRTTTTSHTFSSQPPPTSYANEGVDIVEITDEDDLPPREEEPLEEHPSSVRFEQQQDDEDLDDFEKLEQELARQQQNTTQFVQETAEFGREIVDEIIADALSTLNVEEETEEQQPAEEEIPVPSPPLSPMDDSNSNSLSQPSEEVSEEGGLPTSGGGEGGGGDDDPAAAAPSATTPSKGSSSKSKVAEDISSSPSRVVENIGTFRDRKAFWEEKDEEEKKKRESVSSVEDYTQGIENTAFIGQEVIDKSGHVLEQPSAKLRTPSPYEIERSKEAIFLDTDEEELRQKTDMTTERKVLFKGDEQSVSVEEQLTSISSSVSGRDSVDKSEIETSEKGPQQGHSDNSLKEARTAATNLVTEIESKVGQQFGLGDVVGESSMDITDEELLSTGELSSPETQRSTKAQSSSAQQQQAQQHPELDTTTLEGSGTGPYDTFAVKSSSSGEFFTAPEDSTLKSSSDDPSRPKSWDSSILGQVSGGSNSEYQTALSAGSGASSSESYLGSLSSDASQSETLVASQISLARDQDRDFLLDDDDNSASVQSPPPPLPPRDHPRPAEPQVTQSPSKASQVGQRSVHCEAGPSGGESGSGYPVTLTSSTSGTTVCTQVETSGTFKCEVKGEATREDDQEGNIMVLEHHHHRPLARRSVSMSDADPSALEPPKKTHRRSESQSWSDSLMYGVEEQIREEVIEEEISDLFSRGGSFQQRSIDDDPIERPITPEPGFSPLERKIGYYPGSSFDIELNRQEMGEDEEEEDEILDYPRSIDPRESIFDRMVPSSRLEDIEEEGSLKNSPKSVLSLEMSATSIVEFDHDKGSLEGSGSGGTGTSSSNGRPGSRESSSSLNEFERLESAVLDEEVKVDLSEIEEGHESQVSESDDQETELYEQDSYCDNDPDLMSEADDKMMKIFSERIDIPTDSESSNSNSNKSSSRIPRKSDPIAFFTTTLDPRSPSIEETDTNTSQFDEYHLDPRSELVGGSTDADSSLEFQHQFTKQRISRGMTSSGDSLDEPVSASTSRGGGRDDDAHTPQNLMEISRDSLDLEKESSSKRSSDSPPPADHKMVTSTDSLQLQAQMSSSFSSHPAAPMTDSFTNNVMQTSSRSNVMTDSLEMEGGVKMSESVDSLNGGNLTSTATERSLSTVAAAATMATSTTSTDSLEGGPGVAEHGLSSSSSTAADAAMWSSTSGSVSTLMSSQEDLTLEGTTQS